MQLSMDQQQALQQFCAVYDSLVKTLHDNHGSNCPVLVQHREQWSSMDRKVRGQYMNLWWNTFRAHESKVAQKDPMIFTLDLPPLVALELPKLWWGQAFSPTSKGYLWSYIQKLTMWSKVWSTGSETKTNTPTQAAPEIAPPPIMEGDVPPMLQAMQNMLPPSLLQNVTKVAESYGKKLEEKKINPEDLTLETITRDLITQTDPQLTQKMMMDMAQMFQGMQGMPGMPGRPPRKQHRPRRPRHVRKISTEPPVQRPHLTRGTSVNSRPVCEGHDNHSG